ncbi:hypothetical protein [Gracilibacillus alcaliphilus]|uniref:hypothetical protein n=1 Tax=Gracilibacillus alcaliphilus TaxID=1401441 RepID=UPI001958603E|nr:hypothetical protein [Gracilibacillus alcaliphilus]MBM7675694.1 hypothetical protein [Gracilibacillus alcaliphilus]
MTTIMQKQKAESGMKAIRLTGELLYQAIHQKDEQTQGEVIQRFSQHISDSVRCWTAFMNRGSEASLAEKLAYIYPFAADDHFGVSYYGKMNNPCEKELMS